MRDRHPVKGVQKIHLQSWTKVLTPLSKTSTCCRRPSVISNDIFFVDSQSPLSPFLCHVVKARLHRRFLSRQLDAIFVAPKLHQVSNMFETPAISRRQMAVKSLLVYTCDFEVATLSATKIASSCCDKNCLCKWAFTTLKREEGIEM